MAWPAVNHGDIEDAVTELRAYRAPVDLWFTSSGNASGVAAATTGTIYYMPIFLPAGTVSDVGCVVTTAATAASGGTVMMGLYDSTTTNSMNIGRTPGARLAQTAAVSTETTGAKAFSVGLTVTGGLYYLALLGLVAQASFSSVVADSATGLVGLSTLQATASFVTLTTTGQSALPDPAPSSFNTGTGASPRSFIRMSAVG